MVWFWPSISNPPEMLEPVKFIFPELISGCGRWMPLTLVPLLATVISLVNLMVPTLESFMALTKPCQSFTSCDWVPRRFLVAVLSTEAAATFSSLRLSLVKDVCFLSVFNTAVLFSTLVESSLLEIVKSLLWPACTFEFADSVNLFASVLAEEWVLSWIGDWVSFLSVAVLLAEVAPALLWLCSLSFAFCTTAGFSCCSAAWAFWFPAILIKLKPIKTEAAPIENFLIEKRSFLGSILRSFSW